ncbi:ABC-type nitrate/sulfonate/bicarbonate transport system permease component [Bradyrhizobium sp. LM2.7]
MRIVKPLFESEVFVRIAAPIAVGIVLFMLWEIGLRLASVPVYLFPKPSDIFASLLHNGPSLLRALLVTLRVTLQAFVAAVILGTLIAFMFVQSRAIEVSLFPYAVLLQVTPVVAIAPLIIILVKNTQLSLTICATMVALFPIISNTTLGLRSVDPGLANFLPDESRQPLQDAGEAAHSRCAALFLRRIADIERPGSDRRGGCGVCGGHRWSLLGACL